MLCDNELEGCSRSRAWEPDSGPSEPAGDAANLDAELGLNRAIGDCVGESLMIQGILKISGHPEPDICA